MIKRFENNPILTPEDMPVPCCAVYNSGVIKTAAGEYVMASRFEYPNKRQAAWVSRSQDGINFVPDPEPMRFVCTAEQEEEYDKTCTAIPPDIGSWYDPRLNPVDGEMYVTYAVGGIPRCRIAIGRTEDFRVVHHVSFPLHIPNRNGVLFPERINGDVYMLHRPQNVDGSGDIWIASSPDLIHWGNCRIVAEREQYWEHEKIGPAAPPIKTDEGWLTAYHGVFPTCNGINYGAGVMLLDLEQPWRVVGRSKDPILFVQETYEMIGQVPNVVFPGALIPEPDGHVKIYYGAADYVQCLATAQLADLIAMCH